MKKCGSIDRSIKELVLKNKETVLSHLHSSSCENRALGLNGIQSHEKG